jgi:hypothetical protein
VCKDRHIRSATQLNNKINSTAFKRGIVRTGRKVIDDEFIDAHAEECLLLEMHLKRR